MPAIFTIVSANYIAFAATLMQSVRRFHPEVPRFIILADTLHAFEGVDLAAEVIACDDLGIALIGNMQLWYSVIEFNTALKPFVFQHLLTTRGFGGAIYLDPDIELYAPIEAVFAGLAGHSLVLTPHMTRPLDDGKHPSDLSIMKSGVYNLGFAALRGDQDGLGLLSWWCDRLFAHCRVDVPGNLFTDQRWMDLAPAFVARTLLLRHPGYNVAYWNLVHRTVRQAADGAWLADGLPLAFFHFSGIKPEDPAVFSIHQNRFTVQTLGEVAGLCDEYRTRVLANGWRRFKSLPYGYGVFADGRPIEESMRRWVLDAIDDERLPRTERLELDAAFFDAADEMRFPGGGRLTRFAHQYWRDRPDLRSAFDLQRRAGLDGYVAWLCEGSAEQEGLHPGLLDAARTLRDRAAEGASLPTKPVSPPWPPIAPEYWSGPAFEAAQWLRGEVAFSMHGVPLRLQRQAALLWERRLDLQHYFPITGEQALEDFHLWTLTDGMRERVVAADLFTDEYLDWLDTPAPLLAHYDALPITNAMALTRRSEHARAGLVAWPQFPLDAKARVEQAFWFAYRAPAVFGWPASVTASVRAYLDAASGRVVGSYAIPRGALTLHAMRDDVQQSFDLDSEGGGWRYLCWVLAQGAREFDIGVLELCPGIDAFLAEPSEAYPLLSRLSLFAYAQREDLRSAYNLDSRMGLNGMQNWARKELEAWLDSIGLASLVRAPAADAAPPVSPLRCLVALAGDWAVPSGVGEVLRSAVAALDVCNFTDYVIVDLQSRSVLMADRTVVPAGRPVAVGWTVMFHNADTALDDWLSLRQLHVTSDRVAGHWLWELERLPARWIHAYSFVDEIWACSNFVKEIFEAGARRPVRLLHTAVTPPQFATWLPRTALGLEDGATLFLFMFDFASYVRRKNPAAIVRAFCAAFPDGTERACLLIKTQNASLRPELWAELSALTSDTRVVLRDVQLAREELTGLVASADAFVSLHRSEGFGRGPAEAMMLGVPVILTGYSGTAEFADESCACVVGYSMIPVDPGDYPGVEDQRWAEPDTGQAASYMRWVHEQPEAARAMGRRGQERVSAMLDPAKIGADILALLQSTGSA